MYAPFDEFLKLKPELWAGVASCLTEQGIWGENTKLKEVLHTLSRKMTQKRTNTHVPINKVGKYQGKDEGNTTLPLEMASIVSTALLVGLGYCYQIYVGEVGKPDVRSTRMNLQLADGTKPY